MFFCRHKWNLKVGCIDWYAAYYYKCSDTPHCHTALCWRLWSAPLHSLLLCSKTSSCSQLHSLPCTNSSCRSLIKTLWLQSRKRKASHWSRCHQCVISLQKWLPSRTYLQSCESHWSDWTDCHAALKRQQCGYTTCNSWWPIDQYDTACFPVFDLKIDQSWWGSVQDIRPGSHWRSWHLLAVLKLDAFKSRFYCCSCFCLHFI